MEELVGLLALITFLVSLFIIFFVTCIFELKVNKKIHDFIDTLDEHDKAVVLSYRTVSKLNINDFRKKK